MIFGIELYCQNIPDASHIEQKKVILNHAVIELIAGGIRKYNIRNLFPTGMGGCTLVRSDKLTCCAWHQP